MILKNTLSINNLIHYENEIIKNYEEYLKTIKNEEMINSVSDKIKRHNNHIATLEKLIGRYR